MQGPQVCNVPDLRFQMAIVMGLSRLDIHWPRVFQLSTLISSRLSQRTMIFCSTLASAVPILGEYLSQCHRAASMPPLVSASHWHGHQVRSSMAVGTSDSIQAESELQNLEPACPIVRLG